MRGAKIPQTPVKEFAQKIPDPVLEKVGSGNTLVAILNQIAKGVWLGLGTRTRVRARGLGISGAIPAFLL